MTDKHALKLHDRDNVVILLDSLECNTPLAAFDIVLKDSLSTGHKVALKPIKAGEEILKYGQVIGVATKDIAAGEHVHVHNLGMVELEQDYAFGKNAHDLPMVSKENRATFQGFRRPDNKVGTRNYVGIVTSVNCSATVARLIAKEAENRRLAEKYPNVDGIVPIVHGAGCCIATNDEAFRKLQRTIWGFATHPNFASVLMLGLGCEANQIPLMVESYGNPPQEKFRYCTIQGEGGTKKTVEQGLQWLEEALEYANQATRETVCISEISVALQCGGSDGLSGITSNPALGHAMDLLVQNGGTAVLAETPEIYGAEHLLTNRAVSHEVGDKLLGLLRWWEDYATKHGSEMNNNPTPGNKDGGLTTILEKSLGAVAKAGSTNLVDVYEYGEAITAKGLVFMDSPGYDPVSITGEVASGCNIVCFTTGRGSCYGNKPAPTIKIASNTPMYQRMKDDMDLNCGTIADGTETVTQAGERIFQEILDVASGKETFSEKLGFGDAEFAPWQTYAQM